MSAPAIANGIYTRTDLSVQFIETLISFVARGNHYLNKSEHPTHRNQVGFLLTPRILPRISTNPWKIGGGLMLFGLGWF